MSPGLSVRDRLALGFGAVALILLAQMAFTMVQTQDSQDQSQLVLNHIDPLESLALEVQVAKLSEAVVLRNYVISLDPAYEERFRVAVARADAAWAELDRRSTDPEERAFIEAALALRPTYAQLADQFLEAASGDRETLIAHEARLSEVREGILAQVESFIALQQQRGAVARDAIDAARERSWRTQLLLNGLVMAALLATAVLTSRAVRRPAIRLAAAARALGAGAYSAVNGLPSASSAPALPQSPPGSPHSDELRELDRAFRQMAEDLSRREARLLANARVSTILASSLDIDRLTSEALGEAMTYAGCELGIVYGHDEVAALLVPRSVRGVEVASAGALTLGEGIPGRAALDRTMVVVSEIPSDAPFQVALGFDRLPARTVVAGPLLVGERLVGVLLLASLRDLSAETLNFLEAVARELSVSLGNAIAHQEIRMLSGRLQAQNEQLQAVNEEVQTQNEEIAQQSEEIQVQNEELQSQNEELENQRAALVEADRQKDEFLAIAVHELRNPLTGIKGTAQLIRRRSRQDPAFAAFDEDLATIDRLSTTLVSRINRLLDVTRARMGELVLERSPMDLVELCEACVDGWRDRSAGREIVLESAVERLDGSWDGRAVEQVLDNLIENALRYSPGAAPVRIAVDGDDRHATVVVEDSGIGISDDALPRIFDLYYRAPSAADISVEGLGLGLYVTRQIVDAHGGEITVSSAVGTGTTFEVRLPRDRRS